MTRSHLAYGELASFYGTLIDPARAASPRTNRASNADTPHSGLVFAGRHFDSILQMQSEALRWCHEVYGRQNTAESTDRVVDPVRRRGARCIDAVAAPAL